MEEICHTTYAANFDRTDLDKIFINGYNKIIIYEDKKVIFQTIFEQALKYNFNSNKEFMKFIVTMRKSLGIKDTLSKSKLNAYYAYLVNEKKINRNRNLERFMKLKAARSRSGVISVTIFTSGELLGSNGKPIVYEKPNNDLEDIRITRGGCPMNCHYCPFEKDENGVPTQPRSYLSTEPGNMRATQNKHHPVAQVYDRLRALDAIGHLNIFEDTDSSKIELIISGGTFNFYPEKYIEWFSKCAYYAFNTYRQIKQLYASNNKVKFRKMLSMKEEQQINETSNFRVVGLTIETRPDYIIISNKNKIDFSQIYLFRRIGVTRVQIGIQTTNDKILKKINRKCTNAENMLGLRVLKQNGFKVDIHIMLDLPGSSPEIDKKVIDDIVYGTDLQADQWKIYPTEVTPFTKIKDWYDKGEYKPYSELDNSEKLIDVVIYAMRLVPKYVRINRVVRDIPEKSIVGGLKYSNLRQVIKKRMDSNGIICKDIREREIKFNNFDNSNIRLDIHKYQSSSGNEYFISYCSLDEKLLYGFIRLRLNKENHDVINCLNNKALIRELHVFGEHCSVSSSIGIEQHSNFTQHRGLGKKLIKIAECISYINGYNEIAVISGSGVRNYYKKRGYFIGEYDYMYKQITLYMFGQNIIKVFISRQILYLILIFCISFVYHRIYINH